PRAAALHLFPTRRSSDLNSQFSGACKSETSCKTPSLQTSLFVGAAQSAAPLRFRAAANKMPQGNLPDPQDGPDRQDCRTADAHLDRKSTRLNSSHGSISY